MKKKNVHLTRIVLVFINLLVVVAVVLLCLFHTTEHQAEKERSASSAFQSTVASIGKVAYGYMLSQQQACNDWASYISSNELSMEQALTYLAQANSVDGIMAQLIDYETMQGFSSEANNKGSNAVNYEDNYSRGVFADIIENIHNNTDNARSLYISNTHTNPINAMHTVSFCQDVTLTAEDGQTVRYLLIRAVPLDILKEHWVFPLGYEEADLSLIFSDGAYIIRSDKMKNENFWEYIRIYNNIGYDDVAKLAEEFVSDTSHIELLLDSRGNESYYVCEQMDAHADWYFVASVPVSSLNNADTNWAMVIFVTLGFLLLFLLDGGYILQVNRQLAISTEEARKANLAKTRFLSSMSHDIRTPMNAIVGMTNIASRNYDNPAQVRDCLDKVTLASNHLLTLINDILDISKIEDGKVELNPAPFSIAETTTNLVNFVRHQIHEKNLEFDVHVHDITHEYLHADELRVNQIFINILNNAVKYTDAGGKVTLDLAEEILPQDDKMIKLTYSVTDTGIGMSEEFQKTMYQTFSRASDSGLQNVQGTGLGLAIAKEVVDLMGGTIVCESKLGVGTKFTITLTLPIAERLADNFTLPPIKALVVDDDDIFLQTAEGTLRSLGVTVDTAKNGKQAVQMVTVEHEKGEDYPVVIVDWKMPDMDGIDTIKAIRESVGADVPIILVSAYDWADIEQTARSAGANGFISKPFFSSLVYSKLNEILGLSLKNAEPEDDKYRDLSGKHFLIAEDNELNWEIINAILEIYNITADRAPNGQICLDMLTAAKADTYSLILMDVQMPVLNGLETTKIVRALPDATLANIPIIAMTADAFAEDIRACLAAGMNGHVAKPFDINKLFSEIRDVLRAKNGEGTKS